MSAYWDSACEKTYTAAVEAEIRVSKMKKPATPNTEMIRGARTIAEPQPAVEPEVTAKMKRIRAPAERKFSIDRRNTTGGKLTS